MPRPLRIALFIAAILAVVVLTSVYVFRRLRSTLGLGRMGQRAVIGVLAAAPIAAVIGRAFERWLPHDVAFALSSGGMIVMLGVWISTVLLWAIDGPAWLVGAVGRWRSAKRAASQSALSEHEADGAIEATPEDDESEPEAPTEREPEPPPALARRALLRRGATGVALGVGFGAAGYGALFGRHDYVVELNPIRLPGLPASLDGYRIAQLSDIHFGMYVGEPELRSAVALVRSARPDLIVLTGDLVDHDPAYAPMLGRLVRALEQLGARDGVKVIPGNHDYYAGIDVVLSTLVDAGATVLRNDAVMLGDAGGRFALVGVDDVWAPRNGYGPGPDLDVALRDVPDDAASVLLCHNPVFFPEARGRVGLQLSGHTHAGQVNLGLRPAEFVLPYVEGLYTEGGSQLYVNRGFGTAGPPARVGAPPECTLTILHT